ncbi:MAG: hypothetical protein M1816_002146 [Peltula sp. TS41687]|nr:MAG: hypothetical protein M1816_002146 [Peltula sp. TS41687]
MRNCPRCLSQAVGRVLGTGTLLRWPTDSLQSSQKLLRERVSAAASRSAQRARTADGRISLRSYHSSGSLASDQSSSTSAAQTLPTSTTTSPVAEDATATKPRARVRKASCVPAGVPLKGISYLKNGSDPIAEEDSEYPSWLWTCLDEPVKGKGKEGIEVDDKAGDLYSKSKKERQQAARRLRKVAESNPEQLAPTVPLIEQTIDLPSNSEHSMEGAMEALGARQELTRALRAKRRAGIKEKNFLKGMR